MITSHAVRQLIVSYFPEATQDQVEQVTEELVKGLEFFAHKQSEALADSQEH